MVSHVELVGRIAVGACLGGVIGYERDRHGSEAGAWRSAEVRLVSVSRTAWPVRRSAEVPESRHARS
jgi:uncharacterized membrane protein YhiD involved in acid resistance